MLKFETSQAAPPLGSRPCGRGRGAVFEDHAVRWAQKWRRGVSILVAPCEYLNLPLLLGPVGMRSQQRLDHLERGLVPSGKIERQGVTARTFKTKSPMKPTCDCVHFHGSVRKGTWVEWRRC